MTRQEAIMIIDCYDIGFYDLSGEKIPANKLADALDMAIEALNTDIVRCWECKKQFTNDCYMIYGKNMMRNLFDNDFCSYGERRKAYERGKQEALQGDDR